MARRSRATTNFSDQVDQLKSLLDTFLERIAHDDLRAQVISLIPAFHGLRDLGSGLVVGDHITSARDRILAYFKKYPQVVIEGDELLVVSGIGEWARRVRELRVEFGWSIYSGATLSELIEGTPEILGELTLMLGIDPRWLKPSQYVLMNHEQDREAALRWNQLNSIRKKNSSVKSKLIEYLRLNVGHKVTGEELRYLARDAKEWARRTRELRTEDGWPVITRMQGRPDLAVGEYILEEDRQAAEHDRKIPDSVRIEVLERDNFRCAYCGWQRKDLSRDDPRKFLELHHLIEHAKGGVNTLENLTTLCNVHHDEVHAGRLRWHNNSWKEV